MAHPAPVVPLPAAERREVTELALRVYMQGADLVEQGLAHLANSRLLMEETGLLPPAAVAAQLCPVVSLADYRATRQAVS